MRVVGLDLATTLGWASGVAGGIPRLGAFTLPSTREDIGRYLVAYEDWLMGFLDAEQPDCGFFEAPILSQHTMTARKLMCLAGETERIFVRRGVSISEVNISSAKLFFAGHGRAEKPAMVKAALKRGMPVGDCAKCRGRTLNTRGRPCAVCEGTGKDHNQADAGAVWAFGCASLRGRAGETQRALREVV
jgi:hypothetical protein